MMGNTPRARIRATLWLMTIPDDDPERTLSVVRADDPAVRHVGMVGDTYTILLSGKQTAGRYCLIDMQVPHCGGPGPHRHDFEEMFTILEGAIQFTFRGERRIVTAGTTVNIPANAPHFFTNVSGAKARMLCMCTPAGQEDLFLAVGVPLASVHDTPPAMDEAAMAAWRDKAAKLAPAFATELLER